MKKKKIKYDLKWLQNATYLDMKKVLKNSKTNPGAIRELNRVLAIEMGRVLAEDMLKNPNYIPLAKRKTIEIRKTKGETK